MRTRVGLLLVVAPLLVPAWSLAADFKLKLPPGLQEDAEEIPDDNPITAEKIALGKKFFWDKRWSASRTVACVSCHRPDHGWSDPRTFSTDFAGQPHAATGRCPSTGPALWASRRSVFRASRPRSGTRGSRCRHRRRLQRRPGVWALQRRRPPPSAPPQSLAAPVT